MIGLAVCLACSAFAQGPGVPDLTTILNRLEQAQRANRSSLQAYEVVRQYQFFSHDDKEPGSTVVAEVQFVPPADKSYSIRSNEGSGRSVSIVKRILNHEAKAVHRSANHDISRRNYNFKYLGVQIKDGVRCYALQLIPKREDKSLVAGTAWIDARNFLPWRVEGKVAENPSWWVTELDVELDFANVHGMWLQTGAVGRAHVRIFGLHTVVSHDLGYRTGDQVAAWAAHHRRPEALIGAGLPHE